MELADWVDDKMVARLQEMIGTFMGFLSADKMGEELRRKVAHIGPGWLKYICVYFNCFIKCGFI